MRTRPLPPCLSPCLSLSPPLSLPLSGCGHALSFPAPLGMRTRPLPLCLSRDADTPSPSLPLRYADTRRQGEDTDTRGSCCGHERLSRDSLSRSALLAAWEQVERGTGGRERGIEGVEGTEGRDGRKGEGEGERGGCIGGLECGKGGRGVGGGEGGCEGQGRRFFMYRKGGGWGGSLAPACRRTVRVARHSESLRVTQSHSLASPSRLRVLSPAAPAARPDEAMRGFAERPARPRTDSDVASTPLSAAEGARI